MVDLKQQLEGQYYKYEQIFTYRQFKGWGKEYHYDFCLLRDKSNNKLVVRLQKRFWGITKKMKDKGETSPKWVVYDTFNINLQKDYSKFLSLMDILKQGKREIPEEFSKFLDNKNVDSLISIVDDMTQKIVFLESKKRKTMVDKEKLEKEKEKVSKATTKLSKLREENQKLKLDDIKSNIKKLTQTISRLKSELNTKANDENHFQQELSQNNWIFGSWYDEVIPKKQADIKNQPDFILKRADGFCDIVEIEAPKKKLFTKPNKSGKSQPRSDLIQALTQVIDYIDSYNANYERQYYEDSESGSKNPLNPYRPQGLLIIGRDKKEERKKLWQLNSFLNNITIITYDEFFNKAESILRLHSKKR